MDIYSEDRITLNQLAKECNRNPSTIWRWHLNGVRGVKLETYVEGGCRFTSRQAHRRFQQRCTDAANGTSPQPRTSIQRERDIERAEKELAKIGV
ncbi:DUF1580 domain-containing protein [Bythopirellula goksoeyrii]|uniref:Uncharacterized protein n=1 Tax=Bythopirellula goksoeyrii TaxID=1400387 RepID=A0A5B9QBH9_9BACT|nr:DUF1580 domain-containing protein [Bythopirellula goksoeyrii]QEG36354.1 hypothetical protein Pr1d_36680 [Bythopirellula goksoeyrii]